MSEKPNVEDWAALGIAPTGDADAVRRAYRGRLREVGPESDPEGFQALRAGYERVLAAVTNPAPVSSSVGQVQAEAAAAAFLRALDVRRAAGDEAGAIALVDETARTHPPGSAAAAAIEDVLLEEVAFSRNVSPGLFRHLVERFDWRDTQGRAARANPERHAFLLDRIAAEDWYAGLADGGGVAAILPLPRDRAAAALRAAPITPDGRQPVRDLFEQLLNHATFVLMRFDGGTLGLLREAVEGPPLLADPVKAKPAPAVSIEGLVSPQRRRLIQMGVFGVLGVGLCVKIVTDSARPAPTGRFASLGDNAALPEPTALAMLRHPRNDWVELIPGPDGVRVDWAPVMQMRRAIKELHVGWNGEPPTTVMTLPDADIPLGFVAPPTLKSLAMRIQYTDGTWSEVRHYDIEKARQ